MSSSEPESSPPPSPAPGDIPPPAPSPPLGPQPSAPPSALCSPRSDPRPPQLLKCTRCARTLATISPIGDFEVAPPSDPCALCEDMAKLHGELLEQTHNYEELEHRRPNYGPRMWAIINTNRAQIALRNFLDRVAEAVTEKKGNGNEEKKETGNGEQIVDESEEKHDNADAEKKVDHEDDGAQDRMSTSNNDDDQQDDNSRGLSTHSNNNDTTTPDADKPTTKRARHPSPSPSRSPSSHHPKRVRLSLSLPTTSTSTHRVHFAPSVIFRAPSDKRWNADFSRNSERYRPGRYAAPAGCELLDTSGCSMKESEFFGMMKRGKKWVPTPRGLQLDEEWEGRGTSSHAEGDADGDQEMGEADEGFEDQEEEEVYDEEGFEREVPAVRLPDNYWDGEYVDGDELAHDGG